MQQYLDLLKDIRENGRYKLDRTKVGCQSVFGRQVRFDLSKGFPMVTTKKLHLRAIIHELLWFLTGSTNNEDLEAVDVRIWREWAQKEDVTEEVLLSDQERLALYAQVKGIAVDEAAELLRSGHAVYRVTSIDLNLLSKDEYDHRVMDKAGVPTHTKKVIKPKGDLGPIYGQQWRSWQGADGRVHDQIKNAIELLRTDPASRRNVVSAWNVGELDKMHLNPCHALFQFYAERLTLKERVDLYIAQAYPSGIEAWQYNADALLTLEKNYTTGAREYNNDAYGAPSDGELTNTLEVIETMLSAYEIPTYRLSCQLYQRSADSFLGVPFNIASYALLTAMIAQVVGMVPGDFVHTFGDLHIYSNHMEQVERQLTRDPLPLPKLLLNPAIKNIDDFTFDDIKVVGYESHAAIKGDVAV